MDYEQWAEDYLKAADDVQIVINNLQSEINETKTIGKKKLLMEKRMYYKHIRKELIRTAKKLQKRGKGLE